MSLPRRSLPTRAQVAAACALFGGPDAPAQTVDGRPNRSAPRPRQQPEREDVLTPILNWLRVLARQVPGLCFRRITTTGRRLVDGTYIPNPMKGLEDIQVLVPPDGRLWAIETKAATGRQSPEQRDRQAEVEAAGGVYSLPRSLAEAQAIWEQWR